MKSAMTMAVLSWYDSEIPDGKLSAFMQDIGNELKTQNVGWVSWDDKLQPTTFSTVSDASQQLAHGVITPGRNSVRYLMRQLKKIRAEKE